MPQDQRAFARPYVRSRGYEQKEGQWGEESPKSGRGLQPKAHTGEEMPGSGGPECGRPSMLNPCLGIPDRVQVVWEGQLPWHRVGVLPGLATVALLLWRPMLFVPCPLSSRQPWDGG